MTKRTKLSSGMKSRAKFRSSPEWKDWRLQVIERDDNTCKCCGLKYPSSKLQCHHKNLDKEKYQTLDDINEFVSLCSVCHKSLHSFERKVKNKKRSFCGSPELKELVLKFFV